LASLTLTAFTGCTNLDKSAVSSKTTVLKVGGCAGLYGDMFKEAIESFLEKLGYKIKIVEFSDYVQPNNALGEKEIDLNIFQHFTYLKKFSVENSLDLTYITEIPTAAMGVFSKEYNSIENIKNGAPVAILNDDTNLSYAIYNEKLLEGYFNIIAVRSKAADSQFAKNIVPIVCFDAFKSVIENQSKQYIAFGHPIEY